MKKHQAPTSKLQRSIERQTSIGCGRAAVLLKFGSWMFSGFWSLEFGAFV
jgi:hypothetical protein